MTWVLFSTSALLILPKVWSSSSALLSCLDCQRSEVQLPHFCSARTSKCLKLLFRTSTLPWLPNIWSSAFQTSVLPELRTISSSTSALVRPGPPNMCRSTSAFHLKDVKFLVRTFALPWLPNIWSSASPLTLCFNYQKCEVPLPHFSQIAEVLPSFLKIGSYASALLLCLDCKRCAVLLPQFHCMFLCHEGLAL